MVETHTMHSSKLCFGFAVLEVSLGKVHSVSEKVCFIFSHVICEEDDLGQRFQRPMRQEPRFVIQLLRFLKIKNVTRTNFMILLQLWRDYKRIWVLALIVFLMLVLRCLENFALCHSCCHLSLCVWVGGCVCVGGWVCVCGWVGVCGCVF